KTQPSFTPLGGSSEATHRASRGTRSDRFLRSVAGVDEAIVDPLVIPLAVVVRDVLADCGSQVRFADRDHLRQAPDLIDRTNRSAYALRFGLRLGSRIGCTPEHSRVARNAFVKSGSRS